MFSIKMSKYMSYSVLETVMHLIVSCHKNLPISFSLFSTRTRQTAFIIGSKPATLWHWISLEYPSHETNLWKPDVFNPKTDIHSFVLISLVFFYQMNSGLLPHLKCYLTAIYTTGKRCCHTAVLIHSCKTDIWSIWVPIVFEVSGSAIRYMACQVPVTSAQICPVVQTLIS